MTKSELIRALADDHPHLRLVDVEAVVDTIFDGIASALARGDRVELRRFGVFTARRRRARTGRNLKSGGAVQVEAKSVPLQGHAGYGRAS